MIWKYSIVEVLKYLFIKDGLSKPEKKYTL
jgi:hypothetical protein